MIKAIDDGADGYLLDAFPMNLEQAEAFESFIGSPARIIYLSLAQVGERRFSLRQIVTTVYLMT